MGQVTSERMKNQNPCPLCNHHYTRNHNRHGCRKCGRGENACHMGPVLSFRLRRINSRSGQSNFMR